MKLFLSRFALYILLPLFITVGIAITVSLMMPPLSKVDYDGGLVVKKQRLRNVAAQKKIVLIGGSNLAIGMSSKTLQQKFPDYQVVNYGHRFQFGPDFYLREIKPYLRKGDIVLLMPEYQFLVEEFFDNRSFSPVLFEGLNTQPLSLSELRSVIPHALPYFRNRFLFRNRTDANMHDHNKKSGFNAYGDLTAHWKLPPVRPLPLYTPSTSDYKVRSSTKHNLEAFRDYCTANCISFFVLPPVYAKSSFDAGAKLIAFNEKFYKEIKLPFLVKPEAFCLPDSFFYDTPYHLYQEGSELKANLIGAVLRKGIQNRALENLAQFGYSNLKAPTNSDCDMFQ